VSLSDGFASRFDGIYWEMQERRLGDNAYFLLVLHKEPEHRETWSVYSCFRAFSSRNKAWEVRSIDEVSGANFRRLWAAEQGRWLTVHSGAELAIFLAVGGLALLRPDIVERHLPGLMGKWECAADRKAGDLTSDGFLVIRDHSKKYPASARLAKGKLRMIVLSRDEYRCVICGAAAQDSVHVQLEVHHIIPFNAHGPTVEENLATLCKACHVGPRGLRPRRTASAST
jgi:hypothetical protein